MSRIRRCLTEAGRMEEKRQPTAALHTMTQYYLTHIVPYG